MRTHRIVSICVMSLMVVATAAVAQSQKRGIDVTGLTVSELENLLGNVTEIKENQWENWGLTEEEWTKYQLIKEKTVWATWDGNPSPLQLLAIYSRSEDEKRRYAQMEAKLDRWRLNAAMSFQKIYSHEAAILAAKYEEMVKNRVPSVDNIGAGEKVMIFVNAKTGNCDTRCIAVVKQIMRTEARIDIYAVDNATEEQLFAWATSVDIPVDQVQSGRITLNLDRGEFLGVSEIPPAFAIIPATYVRRGNGWVRAIQ
jgi:integrating conjugative element protein (TIGR03759 family)